MTEPGKRPQTMTYKRSGRFLMLTNPKGSVTLRFKRIGP